MTDTLAGYWTSQLDWPERTKPEHVQGVVPDYTPEEIAEVLRLIHPLRIQRDGRWIVVPTDLASLRANQAEYLMYCDELAMADFKTSAGYRRAMLAAEQERKDERDDRALQEKKQAAEAKDRRFQELVAAGVNPLEAAQIAEQKSVG